jgi:hypothetical protein
MSFLLVPQFGRIAELDALHVRPKGEGHGWPEPKERTKEKAPREPALRVRSLAWKIRVAFNSLRYIPLKQETLSPGFSCTHSPGSKGINAKTRQDLDFCYSGGDGEERDIRMEYKKNNVLHSISGYTAIVRRIMMGICGKTAK